jgi:hypothetical protein
MTDEITPAPQGPKMYHRDVPRGPGTGSTHHFHIVTLLFRLIFLFPLPILLSTTAVSQPIKIIVRVNNEYDICQGIP